MKKRNFSRRTLFFAGCLLAAALTAAVGGTLAIYTSQVYQRAVVRNRYNDVVRFSSDKLLLVGQGTPASVVYYPVTENQTSLTFRVCNYDQSKSTLVSESDISYTINFTTQNGTEGFPYTVSCNGSDKEALTSFHHRLQGGKASANTYTVSFSQNDYLNLKLTVTVTPDDLSLTRNNILTATLIPIAYGTTQQFQVKREFPDSLRKKEDGNPLKPTDLDAYNVLVTATGGDGDVCISWDPSKVEMDRFFRSRDIIKSITQDGAKWKAVLHMNSADETASYLIPFYNPNSTDPEWTDWNDLDQCIQVTVAENQ